MSDEIFSDDSISMSTNNRYISDTIAVTLIPEKRGSFLRHTEYEAIIDLLLTLLVR